MLKYLTRGLGLGGMAVAAAMLAGCSALGQTESTAAIASPGSSTSVTGAADPAAVAGSTDGNGQVPMVGKAITLADASCDQIKAEVATFDADKIPQKLADFGKAKYHPTAEESIRFARYVDVSKAGKDKNCLPGAKPAKKQVTASKNAAPVDPASGKAKKAMAAKAPADAKAPAATAAVDPKAMAKLKKKPMAAKALPGAAATPVEPAAATVDEGVTVTVPDSSG